MGPIAIIVSVSPTDRQSILVACGRIGSWWIRSPAEFRMMDEPRLDDWLRQGGAPSILADPLPLTADVGGIVRVGKSRVSLDLIVEEYENGMAPEDMIRAYDTLELADVYAVIAYYLRHRDEVGAYLERRGEEARSLRAQIEADRPPIGRGELLARLQAREKAGVATGQ